MNSLDEKVQNEISREPDSPGPDIGQHSRVLRENERQQKVGG